LLVESKQLDHLTQAIFKLSHDIPTVVGSLWGKLLKVMHSQLQKRLRDYAQGTISRCWPALGQLLLFRLLTNIFSVSDYRHIIAESANLFLSQCLSQCPVNGLSDLLSGLLCVSLLTDMAQESERIAPESIAFLSSILAVFSPAIITHEFIDSPLIQKTLNIKKLAWIRSFLSAQGNKIDLTTTSTGGLDWKLFSMADDNIDDASKCTALSSILAMSHQLIKTLTDRHASHPGFVEVLEPTVVRNLKLLRPHETPRLSKPIIVSHTLLLETLMQQVHSQKVTRQPLQWRRQHKVAIVAKNPRFEVDYKLKKDSDPDEARAKLKQLTREKKREEKAAMRELRRDSDFLEQEKYAERRKQLDSMREERHSNFAWLEEQQATINEQVRKGGELLRGGGSGIAKKPRVKRK